MSFIPPKADSRQSEWHVRVVPTADIAQQEAVAPGQVTPYKFSGPVVAMGRCYAGLIVASAADLAGGGQWGGCRRQEAPRSYVGAPAGRRRSLWRRSTHIRTLKNHPRHRRVPIGNVHLRGGDGTWMGGRYSGRNLCYCRRSFL